ncbi:MFS transporter [Nocardioides pantholopis]|uniref:MFS transporter n=1 Tax=Nocardioides pantholopis TaxID=2483798 RepID=UPI000FDCBE8D|nr:MFS transporter [Nocardioides pantholopis]
MSTPVPRRSPGLLLAGTVALLLVTMIASFTPTPLFPTYQDRWGLTEAQVSLVFAGYPAGVVVVLLGLGGLSDRIGRRPTLLLGAAVLVAAMLVLTSAGSLAPLLAGRLLQGLGAGLITGAAAAALMDLHPGGPDSGSFVNTLAISLGAALGPVVAGTLADASSRPLAVPYLAVVLLMLVPVALLLLRRGQSAPAPGRGRIVQPARVARRIWLPFSVAAGGVVVTNTCMSLYGAFGPLVAHAVGWTSEAAAGRLVSLCLGAVAVAQVAGRRLEPLPAVRVGAVMAALGWGLTAYGASAGLPWPVLVGTALLGSGAGLCLLGGASLIGRIAAPERRAETYSAFLVVAFGTLGGAALLAGPVLGHLSLTVVLLGATTLTAAVAVQVSATALALARRAAAA